MKREHPVEQITKSMLMAELFTSYVTTLNEKQRTEADKRWGPIRAFWGMKSIAEISSEMFEHFYRWRKGVRPHTLHKDLCCVRQVLKHAAIRHRDFALPYIPKHPRIETNPRPWLTQKEWQQLCKVMIDGVGKAKNTRTREQRQGASDFARFMVASMGRVEELQALRFKHCQIERIKGRPILRCEFSVSKADRRVAFAAIDAVLIYERRWKGDPESLIFPVHHRDAFRKMLEEAKLYVDNFGNRRNYKAMRATSITFALLQPFPPTLFQIARNAGTSVEVIDKYYAKRLTAEHGKDALTAAEPLSAIWGENALGGTGSR